jgi:hypothetical protein
MSFPAALFCYPWDFVDEGLDVALGRIAELGISHLALASVYHAGFFLYPHNPRRKTHLLEDGVAYFHPDSICYELGGIAPRRAELCRERDWFATIHTAARSAGLSVIAWTVVLHNTPLGLAHPEATVENAYGDRYPHTLSPGHPASVAYARGLVRDLTRNQSVPEILLEAVNFRRRAHGGTWVSGHHHERDGVHLRDLEQRLLDLSFNAADREHGENAGIEVTSLRGRVREHLDRYFDEAPDLPAGLPATLDEFRDAHPTLADYERTLAESEHRLLTKLRTEADEAGARLYGAPSPLVDVLTLGVYGEPVDRAATLTARQRAGLRPGQQLMSVVRLGFNSPGMGTPIGSEAQLVEICAALTHNGADMLAFYNYAEAPRKAIRWIRPALASLTKERAGVARNLGNASKGAAE